MVAKVMIKQYEKLRLELIGETERVLLEGFCKQCQKSSAFSMNIIPNASQMHTSYAFQLPVLNAMTLNELYDYPIFGGDFISLTGSVGSQRPDDDLV
jgi:hypothetical protein